jgi:hypothetical protein
MPAGFALLWVLVFVSVVAAVLAAAAPTMLELNDRNQVAETATRIRRVSEAVRDFNSLIQSAPGHATPRTLTLLTTPISSGDPAGCTGLTPAKNTQYNNTSVQNWNTNGPFGVYLMSTDGVWTPLGSINDAPSRSATTIGTVRTSLSDPYFLQIENVEVHLARELDAYVDGTPGALADTVQYTTPAADSTVTLSWRVFLPFPTNSC